MPGVFDRLQKQLDIRKREEGISPIELRDLPPNLRKVMRMMLREVVMKYTDLCKAVDAMSDADRLSRPELDSALAALVEANWLMRYGQDEFTSYKVNLRRRAGSQLGQDVWSHLQGLITTPEYPPESPGAASDASSHRPQTD